MPAPALPAARPAVAAWVPWAVRLAGLWILAGGVLKLLLGTPGDLPQVVRDLPVDWLTSYRVVIAIEVFAGLLALAKPARGWLPALLLLLAFGAVLGTQVVAGASSCGCFGAKIKVPPGVGLGVDVGLLLLLLLARPWRLRGGRTDVVDAVAFAVLGALAPMVVDRTAGVPGLTTQVILDVERWAGRPVDELPFVPHAGEFHRFDGLWFLWKETCEVCDMCLFRMKDPERGETGQREVTLFRLPPDLDAPRKVHAIPEGPFVHHATLSDAVDWVGTPPIEIVVAEGRVVSARSVPPEDCR
jgi:hypothetical protein